jgi:hypothetical protein
MHSFFLPHSDQRFTLINAFFLPASFRPTDRELDGKDLMPLLTGQSTTSPHACIFYWKGCTSDEFCGTLVCFQAQPVDSRRVQ